VSGAIPSSQPAWSVVPATIDHAREMAPRLREPDVAEIWATAGMAALDHLEYAVAVSVSALAWIVEGEVACLFGVCAPALIGAVGHPWLLSTGLVARHPMPFLRRYRPYLAQLLMLYPSLVSYIDARYATAVRWVRWMGFTVSAPMPFGPFGMPHRRFTMSREDFFAAEEA
jgi:hypothetical protein